MYKYSLLVLSMCNNLISSNPEKEDIKIKPVRHEGFLFERERLPESLIHHSSTSVVSQRIHRGALDLQGVPRIISDDSLNGTTVNVAATIAVKTDANCCNSKCCDDDKNNKIWCCC